MLLLQGKKGAIERRCAGGLKTDSTQLICSYAAGGRELAAATACSIRRTTAEKSSSPSFAASAALTPAAASVAGREMPRRVAAAKATPKSLRIRRIGN